MWQVASILGSTVLDCISAVPDGCLIKKLYPGVSGMHTRRGKGKQLFIPLHIILPH